MEEQKTPMRMWCDIIISCSFHTGCIFTNQAKFFFLLFFFLSSFSAAKACTHSNNRPDWSCALKEGFVERGKRRENKKRDGDISTNGKENGAREKASSLQTLEEGAD